MTRLIIALRELGFKNREILALLAEHKNEIEKLFQSALLGNVEPSLEMLPFSETFSVPAAVHADDRHHPGG